MPLKNILTKVGSEILGSTLSTASEKAKATELINAAAKELYESADLDGCLREQVFSADFDEYQITLPYYVDRIRGVRHYYGAYPVSLESMRPRYVINGWDQANTLDWRIKYETPLKRNLSVAGVLTLTFASALTSAVTVSITGSTATADRITETVTFVVGDTTKTTTNNFTDWPGIKIIEKSAVTNANLTITDADGEEVAFIPNHELAARNTLVHVEEPCESCQCFEVLYKTRFSPFKEDYDEFPCGNRYDDAIYCKVRANWELTQEGKEERALVWATKAQNIIDQIAQDALRDKPGQINFGVNRYQDLEYMDADEFTS